MEGKRREWQEGRGREGRAGQGRREEGREKEGGVGCGARRPAGARGPTLANDGPDSVTLNTGLWIVQGH